MSLSVLPDVAPPQSPSIVGAFHSAPTLVRVLAGCLYLDALLRLGQAVAVTAGLSDETTDMMANAGAVCLALALALIPFLLGMGVARGAHCMWLLTLVLVVVELLVDVRAVLAGATVGSILSMVIPVAVLALLLTLFVRQHFTNRQRSGPEGPPR